MDDITGCNEDTFHGKGAVINWMFINTGSVMEESNRMLFDKLDVYHIWM